MEFNTNMKNGDVNPDTYLAECVHIDPLAVQDEYVRVSADLAYWNAQYAKSVRDSLIAKVELDILERELYPKCRQVLEDGGVRPTEAAIDAAIGHSDVWKAAKRQLAEAEADKAKAYGVVDAVRAKKDLLISLGAHIRAEMERDPVLRDQQRNY